MLQSKQQNQAIREQHHQVTLRTAFESALVSLKRLIEGKQQPSCFICYSWGKQQHQNWAEQLAEDLRKADIDVRLDITHNLPGNYISDFTEQLHKVDFVLVLASPSLLSKYQAKDTDSVIADELQQIHYRIQQRNKFGDTTIPLLLEGDKDTALTTKLRPLVNIDFINPDTHFWQLFKLMWRLHQLPFDHAKLKQLKPTLLLDQDKIR